MPKVGDVAFGRDLGKLDKGRLIWSSCSVCGKERWVRLHLFKRGLRTRCHTCGVKVRESYKKRKNGRGYVIIRILPDDFYFPMAQTSGYAFEHRLVMAKHLGRLLLKQEVVHHKNGIKADNRLVNLELMPNPRTHTKMSVCSNCILRKEIRLLQWQIRELTNNLQGKLLVDGTKK